MSILIGCEESATVRDAFRAAGYDAWSCDLLKSRGSNNYHMQCDVMVAISDRPWSGIILHPDCTFMALSGNRWYGKGMPRHLDRLNAVAWTTQLWNLAVSRCNHVTLENPKSVIFPILRKGGFDVQYVQPYQFGHGEKKATGFALHGLPRLEPTNEVEGREERVWRMPPGPNRKRDRSVTYPGIADAMVKFWGPVMEPNAT